MKHYFIICCLLFLTTVISCRQKDGDGNIMYSSEVKFAGSEESLNYINQLISKNEGDANLYLKKAELLFDLKRYGQAKESLSIYKEVDPYNFSATILDIKIMKEEGDYNEALSIAENLFMNDPKESIEFNKLLSSLYSYEKDYLKAIDHINYCIEKDPSNVEYAYLKGIYYFYFKDTSNAFRYLDYAFANGYENNESIALYADLLIDSEKNAKALEVIENALMKDSSQYNIRLAHAKILKENKQYKKSKALTLQLITEKVNDPYSYLNLSDIYLRNYQYDSSLHYARKVIRLDNQLTKAYYIAAQSHRYLGNNYSALSTYLEVLEYDPSDPIAISESEKLQKYLAYTKRITLELDSFKRRAKDIPVIEPKF